VNLKLHNEPVNEPKRSTKIGRNDPCPCGSGKKFKKCHGSTPTNPAPKLDSPDYQHLQTLSNEELASVYCERLVYATLQRTGVPKDRMSALVAEVVDEAAKPLAQKPDARRCDVKRADGIGEFMGATRDDFIKCPPTAHLFGSKGMDDDKHLGREKSERVHCQPAAVDALG
jgi:hypothetical protein